MEERGSSQPASQPAREKKKKAWQWWVNGWHVFTVWHGRLIGPPLQELQMAIGVKGGSGSVATNREETAEARGGNRRNQDAPHQPAGRSMGRERKHVTSAALASLVLSAARYLTTYLPATYIPCFAHLRSMASGSISSRVPSTFGMSRICPCHAPACPPLVSDAQSKPQLLVTACHLPFHTVIHHHVLPIFPYRFGNGGKRKKGRMGVYWPLCFSS
ncbi:hypothetical protein QBC40DRAFT_38390 [Triangularia verruculosa]|uniref:Uncharacterized protein n=1 Tax=Triangularia verruculosa TaxID=2587418 RepID=A0AAN7AQ08_9PEZI|nr:hypothetical protein QBC40DRAFT_38390 [Triangularia verruculosa]